MLALVELKNYTVKKGNFILKPCSFKLYANEIVAVIGQTGAGKTVLLEAIAGFHNQYKGEIHYKGQDPSLSDRDCPQIGFVYQDFLLFPHMTVYDNIAYGLKIKKISQATIDYKVKAKAKLFGLTEQLHQYPGTLSGGEKQRTALARAMIMEPELLILDEPFSALDPKTKSEMYTALERIKASSACTILFVTHDFEEAQRLAERIVVVLSGELKGIRASDALFHQWQDEEVNLFLGLEEKYDIRKFIYRT